MIVPARIPTSRLFLIRGVFLLIAALYCIPLWDIIFSSYGTTFDDAYMFVRYARNLLSGGGFTWNAGTSSTYGPTSIPYVFIVAAFSHVLPLESGVLLGCTSW